MQQAVVKKNGGKKPLIIALSVFGAILILFGIAAALALSDPNRGQSAAKADAGNVLAKLGVAAISGEPARLTTDEVNGLLAEQFPAHTPQLSDGGENTVNVYAPVNYKGIHLGVTANVTLGYDSAKQQLYAVLHSLHLGRLPVDPAFGLRFLKNNLPKSIAAEGNVVHTDSTASDSGLLGGAMGLQISGLDVISGNFVIRVSGNLGQLRDFIVQTLPNALQNLN